MLDSCPTLEGEPEETPWKSRLSVQMEEMTATKYYMDFTDVAHNDLEEVLSQPVPPP